MCCNGSQAPKLSVVYDAMIVPPCDQSVGNAICSYAESANFDMLIVGSRRDGNDDGYMTRYQEVHRPSCPTFLFSAHVALCPGLRFRWGDSWESQPSRAGTSSRPVAISIN